MPGVGFDTFFPKQCDTVFRVMNIAPNNKRIKIFTLPIKNGCVRDLMAIPHVSEADIRHSLLKGELNIKLRAREIYVVESNIDLLQFDPCHRQFLIDSGITVGIDAGGGGSTGDIPFAFKQSQDLIGTKNGLNPIFTTSDNFIEGAFGNNEFHILVRHNGRTLQETTDYIVSESGGVGTGYDTIIFKCTLPTETDELIVDYVVEVSVGVEAEIPYIFKQGQSLVGIQDGSNPIFTTPENFIEGLFGNNEFHILIRHNGRVLNAGIDYIVAESGGSGTGYDTIIFKCTLPTENDEIVVDYVAEAP